MTDANMISLAITLFAIAAGSLFNNVRISDSTTATNKRIDDLRDLVKSGNAELRDLFKTENAHLDQKLDRISGTLNTVLADHETRLRAIEHQSH
jgi:hypothetical protein